MRYRTLGRTGLQVPEIAFGCGNVGGLLVRGSHQEQLNAVSHALELGINYFDTAPDYGVGQSETSLGRVLKELRAKVVLATKVQISGDDLKDIRSAIQRSLEASLSRLGQNYVDVLQLHTPISTQRGAIDWSRAIALEDVLGRNGVADALDTVRSQGLVRFIGFTGIGETKALHQIIDSNRFDLMQSYYNLLNPSAGLNMPSGFTGYDFGRIINSASEHKMGVAVIRVMAGGALGGATARTGYASPTVGGPIVPSADYEADEMRAKKLGFLVRGDTLNLAQAAIRFALMHSGVSTVLVGFSNLWQIDKAAAWSGKEPLPASAMRRLKDMWATDFRTR